MAINFTKENICTYKYNFPSELCIYNISIENTESWDESIKMIFDYIKEKHLLPSGNGNIYFWIKSDAYKNPSRLKQIKSVWNNPRLTWLPKNQCILFQHNNENGEFFSTVSNLNECQIDSALNFSRTNKEAFIFFSKEIKEEYNVFDSYLCSNYYDFEKIVKFFYDKNAIFIRPTGNFDDRYLSVDFYGSREVFSKLNFENLQENYQKLYT